LLSGVCKGKTIVGRGCLVVTDGNRLGGIVRLQDLHRFLETGAAVDG
jgi:hypothetical protein